MYSINVLPLDWSLPVDEMAACTSHSVSRIATLLIFHKAVPKLCYMWAFPRLAPLYVCGFLFLSWLQSSQNLFRCLKTFVFLTFFMSIILSLPLEVLCSRFLFRIERAFRQGSIKSKAKIDSASERQQACATTTRCLKFCVLYLTMFSSSASATSFFSPSTSPLILFFPFFLPLRSHFLLFWRITNIGYSSQRLEQPRSAIGSWSIRQDYSDTENLSESASVSKIATNANQVIPF